MRDSSFPRSYLLRSPAPLATSLQQPISVSVRAGKPVFQKGGDPAAPSDTATLLRLHPSHEPRRGNRPPLRVRLTTSGETRSHGVTGGVYKTRDRIHRDMLIHDY